MISDKSQIQGLDLLRGLCGYLVAISHFQWLVEVNYFEYVSILFVEFFCIKWFVLAPQLIKIIEEKTYDGFFKEGG